MANERLIRLVSRLESDPEERSRAAKDPTGYLKAHDIELPPELKVKISSFIVCAVFDDVSYCLRIDETGIHLEWPDK